MTYRTLARPALALLLATTAMPALAQEATPDAVAAAEAQIERIRTLDDAGPMLDAVITYNPDAAAVAVTQTEKPLGGRTV
ncbi:hypothetical protein ACX0FG_15380, partial [Enterococcus faecium]